MRSQRFTLQNGFAYTFYSLNDEWYQRVRKDGPHSKASKVVRAESAKFMKWMKRRGNAWYPVSRSLSLQLCKNNCGLKKSKDSLNPSSAAAQPSKRARQTKSGPDDISNSKKRKCAEPNTPNEKARTPKTTPVPPSMTESDLSSAADFSSSDEGAVQQQWVKSTMDEWSQRPEPHRSDSLRELAHELKVRDGQGMEYVTLFAWASFQRQVQFGDAIRKLVAARCIQEKRGRDHYEKEMLPHYRVCI